MTRYLQLLFVRLGVLPFLLLIAVVVFADRLGQFPVRSQLSECSSAVVLPDACCGRPDVRTSDRGVRPFRWNHHSPDLGRRATGNGRRLYGDAGHGLAGDNTGHLCRRRRGHVHRGGQRHRRSYFRRVPFHDDARDGVGRLRHSALHDGRPPVYGMPVEFGDSLGFGHMLGIPRPFWSRSS